MSEKSKLRQLALENGVYETLITKKYAARKLYQKADPRIIKAVIPGVIAEISITAGKPVKQGDALMTLDAGQRKTHQHPSALMGLFLN